MAGVERLSRDVKSGLCKARKWHLPHGQFYLYLPNTPETKAATDYLWKLREPAATYMRPRQQYAPIAYQWFLKFGEHRALWRAVPTEIDG